MSKSDLIVREDAIRALRLEYPRMPLFEAMREEWALRSEGFRRAEAVIMRLPSVDVPTTATGIIDAIREAEYRGYMKAVEDRPQGEWMSPTADSYIQATNFYKCSICGKIVNLLQMRNYKYCPNCGAKMKGADDEADNI